MTEEYGVENFVYRALAPFDPAGAECLPSGRGFRLHARAMGGRRDLFPELERLGRANKASLLSCNPLFCIGPIFEVSLHNLLKFLTSPFPPGPPFL